MTNSKKVRATPDQVRGMLRFQAQQEDAKRRMESKKLSDNIMDVAMGKHGIRNIRDTLKPQFSKSDIKQAQFRNELTQARSKEQFMNTMARGKSQFPNRDFMKDIDTKKLAFDFGKSNKNFKKRYG